jgi:hypothetical protein
MQGHMDVCWKHRNAQCNDAPSCQNLPALKTKQYAQTYFCQATDVNQARWAGKYGGIMQT